MQREQPLDYEYLLAADPEIPAVPKGLRTRGASSGRMRQRSRRLPCSGMSTTTRASKPPGSFRSKTPDSSHTAEFSTSGSLPVVLRKLA